nr:hypothetical protein [Mucilaginibacter sp. SP1R1]
MHIFYQHEAMYMLKLIILLNLWQEVAEKEEEVFIVLVFN